MRTPVRSILLAGAVFASAITVNAAQITSFTFDETCTNFLTPVTDGGELIITKVTPAPADARNDMLFDLRPKGGMQSNIGTAMDDTGTISADDAWRLTQTGSDVHFVVVTFPPTGPGQPGRLYTDSGTSVNFVFDGATRRAVGNSIPTGQGASTGAVVIPGTRSRITLGGRQFPQGTIPLGINIAFAPIVDINPIDLIGGAGCTIAGRDADPQDPAATNASPTIGGIIGYNVYRIPDTGGVPTPADFTTPETDASAATSSWVYFMDMRQIHMRIADNNTGSPGTVSPAELGVGGAADLSGMQNPDGIAYSGDEFMIFQDSAKNRTVLRMGGTAPTVTNNYWYAVQPVLVGKVSQFGPLVGFTVNDTTTFSGDHRIDFDGDGMFDGVNLDTVTANDRVQPEFISPQAELGLDGLGLTNGGVLLLSAPIFYDGTQPLPASGQVSLSGSATGNDVNLQFTSGLEQGSVLGYNVYRVAGDARVRVNEQPILAQGTDSNVYQLVDAAVPTTRGAHGSVSYMVEIVYSDGTANKMVGPFSVTLDRAQPVRRRR